MICPKCMFVPCVCKKSDDLVTIAKRAAKDINSAKSSDLSLSLRLLRSWYQAELRGVRRTPDEIKRDYSAAAEKLGGTL